MTTPHSTREQIRLLLETIHICANLDRPDARRIAFDTIIVCQEMGIDLDELQALIKAGPHAIWKARPVTYRGAFSWVADADWSTVAIVAGDWVYSDHPEALEMATYAVLAAYLKAKDEDQ
jgi:hypothetical protein